MSATWSEDPSGASILLATGRPRHDVLIVAPPAALCDLDEDWGSPQASVRLSFLPGVQPPSSTDQDNELRSYERAGQGVLVARGRTALYEGHGPASVTALARVAVGAGVRRALFITTGFPLTASRSRSGSHASPDPATPTGAQPALMPLADYIAVGESLFASPLACPAGFDPELTQMLGQLDGVSASRVAAYSSSPVLPGPAQAQALALLGGQVAVMDAVPEAMAMAAAGVRVAALAAPAAPGATVPAWTAERCRIVRQAVEQVLGAH